MLGRTLINVSKSQKFQPTSGPAGTWVENDIPIPFVELVFYVANGSTDLVVTSGAYSSGTLAPTWFYNDADNSWRHSVVTTLPYNAPFTVRLANPVAGNPAVSGVVTTLRRQTFETSFTAPLKCPIHTFQVGQNHFADTFTVSWGSTSAIAQPTGTEGLIEGWDANGQRVTYAWRTYSAQYPDPNAPLPEYYDLSVTSSSGATDFMDACKAGTLSPRTATSP